MPGAKPQRAGKLRLPLRRGLAGQGIDQIERDPRKVLLGDLKRRDTLSGVMQPPEETQRGIVERLQAERHPVDPGLGQRRIVCGLDRGGIALQCDLDPVGKAPQLFGLTQQSLDQRRRHQAGGAAAEEDRFKPFATGQLMLAAHVGQQRGLPFGMVNRGPDMAVEVAIGALCEAERPVDV